MRGQHEIRPGRRLVQHIREACNERHTLECGARVKRARQREGQIHVVGDQQLDLARAQRSNEIDHVAVRVHSTVALIGAEADGRTDIAGDVVQKVNGCLQARRVRAGHRDATPNRQAPAGASLRIAERASEVRDFLSWNTGAVGNLVRRERSDEIAHRLQVVVRRSLRIAFLRR